MEKKYTPCGGCGATDPIERCIGCFHPFELPQPSEPKIETVTWLNLGEYFTEDWQIMHCRYAQDKFKLDTDLFELKEGRLVKKGGTGWLKLHEVEYMTDCNDTPILTDQDVAEGKIKEDERKLEGAELHERLAIYESIHREQNTYIDCLKDKVRKLKKEKGAVWVKATERLPGWKQPVRWRYEGGLPQNNKHPLFAMITEGGTAEEFDDWEWLDEGE